MCSFFRSFAYIGYFFRYGLNLGQEQRALTQKCSKKRSLHAQGGHKDNPFPTIIHRSLKANITSRAAAAPPPPPPPPQKMSLPFLLLRLHTRKGPRFTKDHKVGAKKVLRRTVLCSRDFEKEPRGQYWALKGEGRDRAFEQRDPFWRERGVTQPPPKKSVRTCDKSSTFFRRGGRGRKKKRENVCVRPPLNN